MHAASFCVLFPNYQSFNVQTVSALVKTLVMMAGEIEYENFIYENGEAIFPFTGHFMILLFVVLISIILMNLLVGLTVNKIEELMKTGEKIQASKRVEDLFGLATIVEKTQLKRYFCLLWMLKPITEQLNKKKVIWDKAKMISW